MRAHQDHDPGRQPRTPSPRAPLTPAPAPSVLAFQQAAGNAATVKALRQGTAGPVVQRAGKDGSPTRPSSQGSDRSSGSGKSMTPADARKIRFIQDKQQLWSRINGIRALAEMDSFKQGVTAFLANIERDLEKADTDETTPIDHAAIGAVIAGFQHRTVQGNKVQYSWYKQNQTKEGFFDILDRHADASAQHGQLWSKMGSAQATEDVSVGRGTVLEASIQGRIFDGLLFGLPSWSASPALGELWRLLSQTYVEGLKGWVTAHVLDGTTQKSVLTTIEWPRLKAQIAAHQVDGLDIIVYRAVPGPGGSDHVLVPVESFPVRTQDEFDAVPKAPVDGTDETARKEWEQTQRQVDLEQRKALVRVYSRDDEIERMNHYVTEVLGKKHGPGLVFRTSTTPRNTPAGTFAPSPTGSGPGSP
ncbi:hypothetical protein [Streptomyces ossamyceticus]|jgi:hypothetical protein|uniref:hypothetical protein n=1 Tax=Streptomyces ossamyceticus TaxID=249581 RepID=UPI0006E1605E|nr:hypothetical protein [Streptomyces ossamyceticus]